VVFAHQDARGEAVRVIDGKLSGRKAVAPHADCADLLLVSAQAADGSMRLFALDPATPEVTLRGYPTLDGQRAADVMLDQAVATEVGAGDTAMNVAQAIDTALDIGLAALCAEAVGIMEATVAATVDYLKTRRQFGQPIGRFQALQHRMADMLLHQEQARSMSYLAAMQCTNPDPLLRQRTLSAAKVTIGQACRFIAQNAVQLHGGMGMTDELILSHWFKRLTAIEMSFGDTDFHLQRFAAQLSREAQDRMTASLICGALRAQRRRNRRARRAPRRWSGEFGHRGWRRGCGDVAQPPGLHRHHPGLPHRRRLLLPDQLALQARRSRLHPHRLRRQSAVHPARCCRDRCRDSAGNASDSSSTPGRCSGVQGLRTLAGGTASVLCRRAAPAARPHGLYLGHHRPAQGRAPPAANSRAAGAGRPGDEEGAGDLSRRALCSPPRSTTARPAPLPSSRCCRASCWCWKRSSMPRPPWH
jgi:hypothetical protein